MFQNYPTGFRSPLSLADKTETKPDAELVEFMRKLDSYEYRIESWSTRAKFLGIAKRLFGRFGSWLDAQDRNPDISQTAYDLIADTIQFINTGRRPVTIQTRISIINLEVADGNYFNHSADRRTTALSSLLEFPSDEYMFRWVNQENGFADMLCTVNFFFGSELR